MKNTQEYSRMANKYLRLIKNMLVLFAGSFATKILTFLMVPFYTSILTTSDYGTADLISNTVLLSLPIFSVLMDEAVMRFTLEHDSDKKQVFTGAFTVSSIGFVAAIVVSPAILLFDTLRPYYWFVILYYVVSWIYNITSNYVKGLDKLSITTTAGLIHTFVYLVLNIYFLAGIKIGIYGYLLAINISNAAAILFLFVVCKLHRNFLPIKKLDWKLAGQMIRYSVPMIPDYISWWVNGASDRYVLTFFCGTSITGIYSISYKIPSLLNQMTSIFSSAWKISSVDNFGTEESLRFYNRVFSFFSGTLLISAAWLVVISKVLAKLLFSNDFFQAWKFTPFLILAYCFSAMAQYIGSIFTASKKTKRLFYSSLMGAITNLCLNFILIPKYQATGACVATIIGYIVIWTVNMINTRRIMRMNFNLQKIIPASILIAAGIAALYRGGAYSTIVSISSAVFVTLLFGSQFIEMFKSLKSRFHRKIGS